MNWPTWFSGRAAAPRPARRRRAARLQVEPLEPRLVPVASPFELSSLAGAGGALGFVLNGAAANDRTGFGVSAAGDVNGDGLGDLLVGAQWADPHGYNSGAAYVVFGT